MQNACDAHHDSNPEIEGVGISGQVGRLLGPLFNVIFTSMIQTYFMLLLFIRFAITHAAILFS